MSQNVDNEHLHVVNSACTQSVLYVACYIELSCAIESASLTMMTSLMM